MRRVIDRLRARLRRPPVFRAGGDAASGKPLPVLLTCSAARRSTWTRRSSSGSSPASGCWSPGPAGASARRSAARRCGSAPSGCCCSSAAESSLFEIDRELRHRWVGADIAPARRRHLRRRARSTQIFDAERPHVVFHCAAHKHVPMMEANPGEAIKNNVFGTKTVADAAAAAGAPGVRAGQHRQGREPHAA